MSCPGVQTVLPERETALPEGDCLPGRTDCPA